MAKRVQIAIDCADPERLADFWATALGYAVEEPPAGASSWAEFSRSVGDGAEAWCAAADPAGLGPRLLFHRVPEPKRGKNRLHLDVRVGVADQAGIEAETARLVGRGAVHLRTIEDETGCFAVLQDPEGNEFCVC
ncbi:VOC family protein [Amycolatopsis orientalis]|uniref:VOC family protein n=1 Tax=Amycolatopsis orientalis TaxID=31958 RepID=UPI000568FEA2|nr:VOC family protein [Amycolatopsis orientalis]